MAEHPKRMNVAEFREKGFLQEANRQFFHPLGLALEVQIDDETGEEKLGGIWDYREDPEGVLYGENEGQGIEKAKHVALEYKKHAATRIEIAGNVIQPIPGFDA